MASPPPLLHPVGKPKGAAQMAQPTDIEIARAAAKKPDQWRSAPAWAFRPENLVPYWP